MIDLNEGLRQSEQVQVRESQTPDIAHYANFFAQLYKTAGARIDVDTLNGVKKTVDVVSLPFSGQGFRALKLLAELGVMGYLHVPDGRLQQVMLSPNYDQHGRTVRPSVRMIPNAELPVRVDTTLWVPETRPLLALAGAVSMEAAGVGGHGQGVDDIEHKLSVMGAVTLGNPAIASGHAQHELRGNGKAISTELSGGAMGKLFVPGVIKEFRGFGTPVDVYEGSRGYLFSVPKSFLDHPELSCGSQLRVGDDAVSPERYLAGLGLGVLKEGGMLGQLDTYQKAMEDGVGSIAH